LVPVLEVKGRPSKVEEKRNGRWVVRGSGSIAGKSGLRTKKGLEAAGGGGSRVMEDCNRMRDSRWQGEIARKEADRGREQKTVIIQVIETANNMVAKTGEKAWTGKARGWG
jgi:hypothetical protein